MRKLRKFAAGHGPEYGISRIGIFGPVARGDETPDSDLDILVEAPVLDLISLVGIKNRLEETFGRPVDAVRKTEYMPPRFKARIEKEVKRIDRRTGGELLARYRTRTGAGSWV